MLLVGLFGRTLLVMMAICGEVLFVPRKINEPHRMKCPTINQINGLQLSVWLSVFVQSTSMYSVAMLVQKRNCSIRRSFSVNCFRREKNSQVPSLEISEGANIRVSKRHIHVIVTTEKAKNEIDGSTFVILFRLEEHKRII
jgi:hypothetical protein